MVFPADFVVMDVEEDHEVPIILGRPFMLTASCVVDMGRKTLEMVLKIRRSILIYLKKSRKKT